MNLPKINLGVMRKANGVAVLGALGWGNLVIASKSGPITAAEWLALGTAGAAVLAAYGLTNDVGPSVFEQAKKIRVIKRAKVTEPEPVIDTSWQSPPLEGK